MVYNNLYPPIMDALMPAFIITQDKGGVPGEPYRLYFSLSKYNSPEKIQHAWLALADSQTNQSVLKAATGVLKLKLFEDPEKEGDNRYYVRIYADNLKNKWEINKVYKAQLRFSSVGDDSSNPETEIENTMASIVAGQNSNRFSEWSTVALLQPILEPTLNIRGFSSNEVIMNALGNVVSGRVNFEDGGELESYQIQIYQTDGTKPEYDSGVIFTDIFAVNEIYHELRYNFIEGVKYTMKITYTTKSAYIGTENYPFIILSSTGEPLDAQLEVASNSVMGRMEIHIFSKNEKFLGNLTVRRASSKENFTIWEDVQHIAMNQDSLIDTIWYDYGVESGVWYKYCVQKRNARGDRGLAVMCKEPAMVLLEDIFLSNAEKCLRIKFNPQISSYAHTLAESSTQTIGAKYPFIKRNANTHYRQFSISGLISHFMDEGNLFTSKEELFKNNLSLYEKYNEDNRITDYNDFILEQKFREKIEEFLYDGQVKLFRSSPEGTMLVRLMNISLNPEPTLGRMLYSFTATAYEIADFTVDNLKKYNLQSIGSLEQIIVGKYKKNGHINIGSLDGNLLDKLQEEEDGYKGASNYKRKVKYLNSVKISLEGKPSYYDISKIGETPSADNPLSTVIPLTISEGKNQENVFYGYVISINNQPFLIRPQIYYPLISGEDEALNEENEGSNKGPVYKENQDLIYYGYYELKGEDLQITQLSIKEGSADIEYQLIGEEVEDIATLPKEIYLYSRPSQLTGYFNSTDELKDFFKAKHNKEKETQYEKLYSISEITVEADPDTVFYLQDSADLEYLRFVVGETGTLSIKEKDFSIKDICFLGKHMEEKEKNILGSYLEGELRDNEFITDFSSRVSQSVEEIENPKNNYIYRVKTLDGVNIPSNLYNPKADNSYSIDLAEWCSIKDDIKDVEPHYTVIYYKDQWYLFTYGDKQDIVMPTYAQIEYKCEIEKGEYE